MKIREIAYALPARRATAVDVAAWTGSDPKFIAEKIGIESRAFLDAGESGLDLASRACAALFAKAPALKKENVKLLIVVTQNPDYKLPHQSALLQNALGLGNDTAAFDVNLGCSGYVYALTVAKGFMAAEELSDALLVTCDPYSRIMASGDRDTVSVFGDAATATWLSSERGAEIGRPDLGTDGAGGLNLIVKAGGAAQPWNCVWSKDAASYAPEEQRLKMDGRAIFNFMIERIPGTVQRCLSKNGLEAKDIDLFVFHQASRFMVESLRKRMGLDAVRVPVDLGDVGNTVSSSIPLLLSRRMDRGGLAGQRVLVSGFGVGLSWATNVLNFGGAS